MQPLSLMTLCRAVPHLCRAASHPPVRQLLDQMSRNAHPADAGALLRRLLQAPDAQALGGILAPERPLREALSLLCSGEGLSLLYVCRQCTARELLTILTRCTCAPSAEGMALLAGQLRQEEARQRYALQLLWRIHGDDTIPDAWPLFDHDDGAAPDGSRVRSDLLARLQEGDPHD